MNKKKIDFEKKQTEIIERFSQEGIKVRVGKRNPINRQYSGIIGRVNKILILNFY